MLIYIIITSVLCTVLIHAHEFSTVCTDLSTSVTIEAPALQCQLWTVSVHTTPSPRQRTWPCQWCPVDLREKTQATSVAWGEGEEDSSMDANEAVIDTTSWHLTVIWVTTVQAWVGERHTRGRNPSGRKGEERGQSVPNRERESCEGQRQWLRIIQYTAVEMHTLLADRVGVCSVINIAIALCD